MTEIVDRESLPMPEEVDGTAQTWTVPGSVRDVQFEGVLLGVSSTQKPTHRPHPGEWANRRSDCDCDGKGCFSCRCSACRFTELRLFRTRAGYLLHRSGLSDVPGEEDRFSEIWCGTADLVLDELVTVRPGMRLLRVPAVRLLTQAAAFDDSVVRVLQRAADDQLTRLAR